MLNDEVTVTIKSMEVGFKIMIRSFEVTGLKKCHLVASCPFIYVSGIWI